MAIAVMNWVLEDAPDLPAHCFGVLMALASKAHEDGTGAYPGQEWLAERARKSDRAVRNDLATLEDLKLIRRGDQSLVAHLVADERPVVWDLAIERKHTSARNDDVADESDSDQQEEDRDRKHTSGRNSTSGRKHTSGRDRKHTSGDTSGDKSTSPPSGERARAGARTRDATSKSNQTGRRGTRIPADFANTVTAEMVAWASANCPGVDGKAETAAFVDHFIASSDKNAHKRDWVAAWRNWLRREQKRVNERHANSRASPASNFAQRSGSRAQPPTAEELEQMSLEGTV